MKFQIPMFYSKKVPRIPMVVAICRTINVEMIILPIFHYCRETALLL